jgi:hypothetical protein
MGEKGDQKGPYAYEFKIAATPDELWEKWMTLLTALKGNGGIKGIETLKRAPDEEFKPFECKKDWIKSLACVDDRTQHVILDYFLDSEYVEEMFGLAQRQPNAVDRGSFKVKLADFRKAIKGRTAEELRNITYRYAFSSSVVPMRFMGSIALIPAILLAGIGCCAWRTV